jgi:hypothetical protein
MVLFSSLSEGCADVLNDMERCLKGPWKPGNRARRQSRRRSRLVLILICFDGPIQSGKGKCHSFTCDSFPVDKPTVRLNKENRNSIRNRARSDEPNILLHIR